MVIADVTLAVLVAGHVVAAVASVTGDDNTVFIVGAASFVGAAIECTNKTTAAITGEENTSVIVGAEAFAGA